MTMSANSSFRELEASLRNQSSAPEFGSCRATSIPVRWLKFNVVGGIGIVVQFAALFLLKSVLHFNYLAATAIAVEAAVVHNFVWHEQFTWADRIKSIVAPHAIPVPALPPRQRRCLHPRQSGADESDGRSRAK